MAAVNIASAPTGQLIPPSNTLIVYATVAGSVSVAALFMAGYIPGIAWGISLMFIAGYMAKKRGYVSTFSVTPKEAIKVLWDALPSLLLIIIVIGGIRTFRRIRQLKFPLTISLHSNLPKHF